MTGTSYRNLVKGGPGVTWDLWTFIFGLIGALGVLGAPMLWLSRRIRALSIFSDPRFAHFLDDWFGEQVRPGFPGRPGIPERLARVEERTRQLTPNGGSHLADKIAHLVRDADARSSNTEVLARIEGLLSAHGQQTTVTVTPPGPPE
jgi:hypothetical protein